MPRPSAKKAGASPRAVLGAGLGAVALEEVPAVLLEALALALSPLGERPPRVQPWQIHRPAGGGAPEGPLRIEVAAPRAGFVDDVDPYLIGEAVVELGGGRRRAEDAIDPSVGILLNRRHGDRVEQGEPMALVLAGVEQTGRRVARDLVAGAFRIGDEAPPPRNLIKHLVTSEGRRTWWGGDSWSA